MNQLPRHARPSVLSSAIVAGRLAPIAFIAVVVIGTITPFTATADDLAPPAFPCIVPGESAKAEWTRRALDQATSLTCNRQSLSSLVRRLEAINNIRIELDEQSLREFAVSRNAPVTLQLRDVPLRAALKQLLNEVEPDFAFTTHGESLLVTYKNRLPLQLRIYNVGQLLAADRSMKDLAEILSVNVTSTFDDNPVTVAPFRKLLLVTATESDHEHVAELLAGMLRK